MSRSYSAARAPLLLLWAVILSSFTVVLGGAPLRVFRQSVGSALYWLITLSVTCLMVGIGWSLLAIIFAAQAVLVGAYAELEGHEFSLRQATGVAVSLTVLVICSSFYIWTAIAGKAWLNQLTAGVNLFLERAAQARLEFLSEVKAQDIIIQLPSAIIVGLIFSLALALILEGPFSRWAGVKMSSAEKLTDFRNSDFLVWVFIAALLGAFGGATNKAVEAFSLNALNISAVFYFFQGLAVMCKYFITFKVGLFWRYLGVFLFVFQLPMVMGVIGLVDYWADFRRSFVKKAAELKKKSIRE